MKTNKKEERQKSNTTNLEVVFQHISVYAHEHSYRILIYPWCTPLQGLPLGDVQARDHAQVLPTLGQLATYKN